MASLRKPNYQAYFLMTSPLNCFLLFPIPASQERADPTLQAFPHTSSRLHERITLDFGPLNLL